MRRSLDMFAERNFTRCIPLITILGIRFETPHFLLNVWVLILSEALKCWCTEYQVQVAQSITGSLHQLHRDWSERARRLMEMSWCLQSPVRITHWSTVCFILINCWLTQTNNHFPSGAVAVRGLIISDIIITLIITDIILTLIFRAPDRYISPGVRG